MSKSIKVSQKHGVNPTIPVCFFCGEPKNEIALLGQLKNDVEAPKNCVLDYEPCDKCLAQMDAGVAFMEASENPKYVNQVPIIAKGNQAIYPTGQLVVLKAEAPLCVDNKWEAGTKMFCDGDVIRMLRGESK